MNYCMQLKTPELGGPGVFDLIAFLFLQLTIEKLTNLPGLFL
jgi:hypothetical protein